MVWTPLKTGKYKGRTFPEIVFIDPDWFFWAYEQCEFAGDLAREATDVYLKAKSIRIPEGKVVEYVKHRPSGKFAYARIVDIDSPYNRDKAIRRPCLDLSVPRALASYDKSGGKVLVRQIKQICFGSSKYRLTRERAETFFGNNDNFLLTHGGEDASI